MKLPDILPHLVFPWYLLIIGENSVFTEKNSVSLVTVMLLNSIHFLLPVSPSWPCLGPSCWDTLRLCPTQQPALPHWPWQEQTAGRGIRGSTQCCPCPQSHTPSFLTADYHTHTVALNQFSVAGIRSWGHCELMVVSRRWMFIFVSWDWVVRTKLCPWLLANISKSSPCRE